MPVHVVEHGLTAGKVCFVSRNILRRKPDVSLASAGKLASVTGLSQRHLMAAVALSTFSNHQNTTNSAICPQGHPQSSGDIACCTANAGFPVTGIACQRNRSGHISDITTPTQGLEIDKDGPVFMPLDGWQEQRIMIACSLLPLSGSHILRIVEMPPELEHRDRSWSQGRSACVPDSPSERL